MKTILSTLIIASTIFASSAIAKSSSPSNSVAATTAITTYSVFSSTNRQYANTGLTSEQIERLVSNPDSLTGKYNTESRRNAVKDHEVCSAVLSGTIHKGKRMTILKTSDGDFIMEKFFVKEFNQYLYASSFDLSTFECE